MSAQQGFTSAQLNLGASYINGDYGEVDYEKGLHWLQKAALQGSEIAQLNLAAFFLRNDTSYKNRIESYAWYNIAKANGNDEAFEKLKSIELTKSELLKAQKLSTERFKLIQNNSSSQ